MTQTATGTFTVEMTPQPDADVVDGVTLGRMALSKQFSGDFSGTGKGQMLTAMTAEDGSAGYVAIERLTGSLHGHRGGFVLQHRGTMDRGARSLSIRIVPDSGTGELAGITGSFELDIREGVHHYTLHYRLPGH
ncbi:DUF3224 domain-containing protein [Pseudomarimonas salicorniae]|uniref:DUF3224 domain-containing protein n=1 Tax=Pseudomarimonas salicorniae TaxID=2933270 RepID=A0ABT0GCH9_9GAMM|nr:DUF3224 domain-containing protein [Lysobacter sp. CAU 1642]MCK7592233.1 DUF3224 domain-containing protein [Lysobacter sp. CAU 1642]